MRKLELIIRIILAIPFGILFIIAGTLEILINKVKGMRQSK